MSNTGTAGREFIVTREFDAPRDLVWKAWTEPNQMEAWWGPKGLKTRIVKMDLRPGGLLHYSMATPDGKMMWGRFIYREITPQEKLVFIVSFSDENADITRHPMAPDWPKEMFNTVNFTEKNGKTTIELRSQAINATDAEVETFVRGFSSMTAGYTGTLDQLDAYLASAKGGK